MLASYKTSLLLMQVWRGYNQASENYSVLSTSTWYFSKYETCDFHKSGHKIMIAYCGVLPCISTCTCVLVMHLIALATNPNPNTGCWDQCSPNIINIANSTLPEEALVTD